MHRNARIAAASLAIGLLAACAPPKPPEEERRPEPQAQEVPPKSAIVEYADSYKDRARSAESQQLEAADQQRAQIDAATQ